jgi:hypothetical protein
MRMPSTSERIRMYSADDIAKKAISKISDIKVAIDEYQPQGTY